MGELIIDGVGKRYRRDRWALRGITLRQGEGVLGLVGANGAGKSTLLRILATVLDPTEGRVLWDGQDTARDPYPLRRALGYLPQEFGTYPQLTLNELLRYIGALKGLSGTALSSQIDAALEAVHLRSSAGERLRTFSGGMIRRAGIAQALLGTPGLLVLDEPTSGLDPGERLRFRETIAALSSERLVILSTHIVSDLEAMATDLALLHEGELVWVGTPEALLADAEGVVWSATVTVPEFEQLRARFRVSTAVRHPDSVTLRLVARERPHPQAVAATPTLEDAYLLFTGVEGTH